METLNLHSTTKISPREIMRNYKYRVMYIIICFIALCASVEAQNKKSLFKIPAKAGQTDPKWVKLMYSEDPNVWEVESAYNDYYAKHKKEKGIHTQNYKHWMRRLKQSQYIAADGHIYIPPFEVEQAYRKNINTAWKKDNNRKTKAVDSWMPVGPFETVRRDSGSVKSSLQVNVYTIDQAANIPNMLFCGTETGDVFKTENKGLNWTCMTNDLVLDGHVETIKISPDNSALVVFCTRSEIYRSTDAGSTWTLVLSRENLKPRDILFFPGSSRILVASGEGLFVSIDNGASFTRGRTAPCWDLELKPGSVSTVYMTFTDLPKQETFFGVSTDFGRTFDIKTTGWFGGSVNNLDNSNAGARIAVTPADPNYVYVALLGNDVSDTLDINWLGVYKSTDGGDTWTLPAVDPGGPYDSTHYCLSYDHPYNNIPDTVIPYQQGFYNLAIAVSATNKEKIMVGSLNLFESTDGGATYKGIGGYLNELDYQGYRHPDIQEIEINGNDVWVASDGGIDKYSTDWSSLVALNNGINGSEYWGFDSGWNDDILVGGRYHNGNAIMYDAYAPGKSRYVGGGEAATGYVEKANTRKIHFSDTQDVLVPDAITDPLQYISNLGIYPTQVPGQPHNQGELVQHPEFYSRYYLTKDNQVFRSEDFGNTFQPTFGGFSPIDSSFTSDLEISRANPDIMYVVVKGPAKDAGTNAVSFLFRSSDAGANWTYVAPPDTVSTVAGMLISLSDFSSDRLYMAIPNSGNSGAKIFFSLNGGATWVNVTTTQLNGETIRQVMYQYGTQDHVYLVTTNKVFYNNPNLSSTWEQLSNGLPAQFKGNFIRPFYRDGLVRIASLNRGIWSSPLFEPSKPRAQPTIEKEIIPCAFDIVQLEDYSVLNHSGASWSWSFSPAVEWVSDPSARNPQVKFGADGNYTVTLFITDGNGDSDSKSLVVNVISDECIPATCSDGIKNGNETGVDCGGPDCVACLGECSNPIPITCGGTFTGDDTGVAITASPNCVSSGNPPFFSRKVWYSFTGDGSLLELNAGFISNAVLMIYSNNCDNLSCELGRSSVFGNITFQTVSGVDYLIMFSGFDTVNLIGSFSFNVTCSSSCSDGIQNGNETGVDCGGPDCEPCVCSNPIPITCGGTFTGDDTGVAITASPNCISSGNPPFFSRKVWYSFTGDGSLLELNTGIISNAVLMIYSNDCDNLSCELGDSFFFGTTTFQTISGVDYLIMISGFDTNNLIGSFSFDVTCSTSCADGIQNGNETGVDCGGTDCPACTNPPANDDCVSATTLILGQGSCGPVVNGSNIGATDSGIDHNSGCQFYLGGNDVWFSFVAPPSGSVVIQTSNRNLEDIAVVYDGCTGSSLACDDGVGNTNISLTSLTSEQTYFVAIYSVNTSTEGTFDICAFDADATCTPATVNFSQVDDAQCASDNYTIELSIPDLGSASSINITSTAGTGTHQGVSTGFYSFLDVTQNDFPVTVTIADAAKPSCSIDIVFQDPGCTCIPPLATLIVDNSDCATDHYFIDLVITDMGSSTSLDVTPSTGAGGIIVTATGTSTFDSLSQLDFPVTITLEDSDGTSCLLNLTAVDPGCSFMEGPCFDFMVRNYNPDSIGLYEVSDYIISTSTVDTVNGGGNVEYSVGNEISLEGGFEVSAGTQFHAFIEGCPGNSICGSVASQTGIIDAPNDNLRWDLVETGNCITALELTTNPTPIILMSAGSFVSDGTGDVEVDVTIIAPLGTGGSITYPLTVSEGVTTQNIDVLESNSGSLFTIEVIFDYDGNQLLYATMVLTPYIL